MSPEDFRMNLNALIQNLRNVTWLLQKRKAELDGFQEWYGEWQKEVGGDPVLRWVQKARNRIVKESDLELHSEARVKVTLDWLTEREKTLTLPSRFTTQQILVTVLRSLVLPPEGLLAIQRRRVDRLLPDRELLAATSYAYGRIASIIAEAHHRSGIGECDLAAREPDCVTASLVPFPPCMGLSDDTRSAYINLANGADVGPRYVMLRQNDDILELAKSKFGDFRAHGDAIERVPRLAEAAKRVLSASKFHATFVTLLKGEKVLTILPLVVEHPQGKFLAMNLVADEVERLNADGLTMVVEIWLGLPGGPGWQEGKPVSEQPGRKEALQIVGITRSGRVNEQIIPFTRGEDGEIIFQDPIISASGPMNILQPVMRRWAAMDGRS
ncbi:hypothetical protein O7607_03775 [Micromonospora sp. WMMA1949]|uniref:hypothetical protein n=1 Tax=Micromonospora sp. WMMA1949 TaxID=3015162 RepID=UPI0022B61FCE|nr:hypothetical protein [Micromonospora sp. WMMA1949]MCZ7424845.1 hypothetical protein [Micromonospora sp. WMMA1949]